MSEMGDRADHDAGACDRHLARPWLLARLSGHLDRVRARIDDVLALDDGELIDAVAGDGARQLHAALEQFDPAAARAAAERAGLEVICFCDPAYPDGLRGLPGPPSALYVAGGLERCLALLREEPVAIVGARRASQYGLEVARSLGRGIASSGVTVVSGMAAGIDSAAHEGALSAAGPTVAVLPGSADRVYPPSKRSLHRRLVEVGAAVSELPPGADIRRWMFPARNRIIAALSALIVVVEARHRSGALVTARHAAALGRTVGAVPGRITSPQSAGPNGLLALGATVVRDAQDALDAVFGAGVRRVGATPRAELEPEQLQLLEAVAGGWDTMDALARGGIEPERALSALAALELDGYIVREPGGRFGVQPGI
jgi:DNA processing protein